MDGENKKTGEITLNLHCGEACYVLPQLPSYWTYIGSSLTGG